MQFLHFARSLIAAWLLGAGLSLAVAGCNGGSPRINYPSIPAIPATTSPSGVPFNAAGPQSLAVVSGWTSTLTIPSGSVPATAPNDVGYLGATVSLSLRAGLSPLSLHRLRTQGGKIVPMQAPPGAPVVVADFHFTDATSLNETLANIPAVTIAPPSGTNLPVCASAPCIYQAALIGTGVAQWEVVGQATVTSNQLTFVPPGNFGALALNPGDAYDLVLYSTSATLTVGGTGVSNGAITFASPSSPAQTVTVSGGVPPYTVTGTTPSGIVTVGAVATNSFTVAPVSTNAAGGTASITFADADGGMGTLTATVTGGTTSARYAIGSLYVANDGNSGAGNTISVYAPGATGNATPIGSFSAAGATPFFDPDGVTVDSSGDIYVVGYRDNAIYEFAPGASGSVAPIAIISGSNTGMMGPTRIALDSGLVYVVTDSANGEEVLAFPAGTNGNVAPTLVIGGSHTPFANLNGVAFDSSHNLYVSDVGATLGGLVFPPAIYVYTAGSFGAGQNNVAPSGTISGSNTGLAPAGIRITGSTIYVANPSTSSILTFPVSARGNVAPSVVLGGGAVVGPEDVTFNSSGNVYVSDYRTNTIWIYPPGAASSSAPTASLSGPATGLNTPIGISF